MRKTILLLSVMLAVWVCRAAAQMTVKDSDSNVLMQVNDEGSVGSMTLPSGGTPSSTSSKLYNVGGALYWNGNTLGMAGSAGGWTDGGPDVYLTTTTDQVGIGTTSPSSKLDVRGTLQVGVDDTGYDVNFYGADSGGRLFWDASKMAFRAGIATGTEWDGANVGSYSTAMGECTTASGSSSTAMGYNTTASGT